MPKSLNRVERKIQSIKRDIHYPAVNGETVNLPEWTNDTGYMDSEKFNKWFERLFKWMRRSLSET